MKLAIVSFAAFAAGTLFAKGLACGGGGLSPMEARLEQAAGGKNAKSTRIQNAQKASAKIQRTVPKAMSSSDGCKVTYRKVDKPCCNSRQTITASGGAKVGVGATKAAAASAVQSPKASNRATW